MSTASLHCSLCSGTDVSVGWESRSGRLWSRGPRASPGSPDWHRAPAHARSSAAPALLGYPTIGGLPCNSIMVFSRKKEQKGRRTVTFLNTKNLTRAVHVPNTAIGDAGPKPLGHSKQAPPCSAATDILLPNTCSSPIALKPSPFDVSTSIPLQMCKQSNLSLLKLHPIYAETDE